MERYRGAHRGVCAGVCAGLVAGIGLFFTWSAQAQETSGSLVDAQSEAEQRPLASVEELASLPAFSSPELSPNGEWLAWFGRADNRRALVAKRVRDNKTAPFVVAGKDWTLRYFQWLSDSRMLLSISLPKSNSGVPVTVTRLAIVDPGSNSIELMFTRDTAQGNFQIQDRVVSTLPGDPDQILVQMNPAVGEAQGVRYASLKSGRLKRQHAQKPRRGILEWLADSGGNVRAGFGVTSNQKSAVMRLKDSAGKWRDYPDLANDPSFRVVGLPVDRPGTFYVLSDHEFALNALYEFNADTDQFGKLLAQNDASEVSGISLDSAGSKIETVYYSSEFVPTEYLDPKLAALTSAIDRQLPDSTNTVVSATNDRQFAIIRSSASDIDPHFYLFDGKRGRIDFLASEYRALQERQMAKTELESYAARDGLTIPAYVTLPPHLPWEEAIESRPQIPFVVLPHGGPHARNFLHFDWLVQVLASKGFGVLQMNFRGSTGYGEEFLMAGKGNWGKAMQDDVTDGTRWLLDKGLAHPKKICIAGGSYGGYAALMGVVKEPALYQAAVSFNGVSDLPDLLRLSNRYIAGRYSTRFIGRLWKDRKSLAENSPARRAKDVKVPVLLVHGEKDRVVDVRQSRKMYKALRARKSPIGSVEYLELDGGDHYLSRGDNRVKFADRATEFLVEHCNRP